MSEKFKNFIDEKINSSFAPPCIYVCFRVVAVVTGGNVDMTVLGRTIERGLAGNLNKQSFCK
jgi:threonine dehydratase